MKLLVTDLDNTLYDWVTFFSRSFYAMVDVAIELLAVPREELLDDLREVHQRYRNSEHSFALLETRAARRRFPGATRAELAEHFDAAFHRFNSVRKETLCLYPGVRDTLDSIASRGVPIIAYTEATVPNALFRLQKLEIAPLFSGLYASVHEGEPHPRPDWRPRETGVPVRYLRRGERKPNPEVLQDICRELNTPLEETLYVGDSISRDVGMAKAAGVCAAWAEFGTRFQREDWDRLVRVTHWTQEDVERARMIERQLGDAVPDAVLHRGYSELLDHFDFWLDGETRTHAAREA